MALFSALAKITNPEPLEYIVALLGDLVDSSNGQVLDTLVDLSKTFDVYTPLFATIRRLDSNWYLNKESSYLLRLLIWFAIHTFNLSLIRLYSSH